MCMQIANTPTEPYTIFNKSWISVVPYVSNLNNNHSDTDGDRTILQCINVYSNQLEPLFP